MRGLLADVNAVGQLRALVAVCRAPRWSEIWVDLSISAYEFSDFNLNPKMLDTDLWTFCQREKLVLVTGNRNADGKTSLTRAIAEFGTVESLPVFTLADIERVTADRDYCNRCAVRMMELLLDMERIRGSGRVYIP